MDVRPIICPGHVRGGCAISGASSSFPVELGRAFSFGAHAVWHDAREGDSVCRHLIRGGQRDSRPVSIRIPSCGSSRMTPVAKEKPRQCRGFEHIGSIGDRYPRDEGLGLLSRQPQAPESVPDPAPRGASGSAPPCGRHRAVPDVPKHQSPHAPDGRSAHHHGRAWG